MRKILIALMILSLTACEHQIPIEPKPLQLDGAQYRIKASRVDVVDDYGTPSRKNQLAAAMHGWADKRLVAAGNVNIFEVHITDALIVKKELPKQKTGIEGWLTKEQTEEYNGKLTVELKLYTPDRTLPAATAKVQAEQSHTLKENATAKERQDVYRQITSEIMTQVDGALERNIQSYFSNYLM